MLPWALTIFLSAFLLFQVQPILAKMLLPWFGGAAAVWAACILFFQSVLLLGYLYAHAITRFLLPKHQALLHQMLLGVSLIFLPLLPDESGKPTGSEHPALKIVLLLAGTVGLPYLLLSSTGPLLQAWFTTNPPKGGLTPDGTPSREPFPYRLYALSNAGSMLALLTYPFLVETHLTTRQQSFFWTIGYLLFILCCGSLAISVVRNAREGVPRSTAPQRPTLIDRPSFESFLIWVAYAACSSSLLLAVTNHLSLNIASIPFLWILPLSLYLLSFIVCFSGKSWRWRPSFLTIPPVAVGVMAYLISGEFAYTSPREIIVPLMAGFFVCCMVCHGEIARSKPHPRHLTAYYLMISLGGALGGMFVALLAPYLFLGYYELPLSLAGIALLAWVTLYRSSSRSWRHPLELAKGSAILMFLVVLALQSRGQPGEYRQTVRNFYGVMRVKDEGEAGDENASRKLYSGSIIHGRQYLHHSRRKEPLSYYTPVTGVGRSLRLKQEEKPALKVGIVGLGAGTLAAYGREGDLYRFYEIDSLVIRIARSEFTFLKDSSATVEILYGDARLVMEREPEQGYDVLVIDAFFSDAVPVHLLTKEAFAVYARHLKPDGILAANISNKYLNLQPVIERAAREAGYHARLVDEGGPDWALLSYRLELFDRPTLKGVVLPLESQPGFRTWTDDNSNLFQILK